MVSHDEPFDPNIHNAVQSVDHPEVESGQIVETFQTGYKYKERPLREAMDSPTNCNISCKNNF